MSKHKLCVLSVLCQPICPLRAAAGRQSADKVSRDHLEILSRADVDHRVCQVGVHASLLQDTMAGFQV